MKKIYIASFILLTFLILFCISFILHKYNESQRELFILKKKSLNGNITILKDLHRGCYLIGIKNQNGGSETYDLPIGYDIKLYHIAVGDSVSKPANVDFIYFHTKHGIFFTNI